MRAAPLAHLDAITDAADPIVARLFSHRGARPLEARCRISTRREGMSNHPIRSTRRQFLGNAGCLGVAAAGLAVVGDGHAWSATFPAQDPQPLESIQVLIGDVPHDRQLLAAGSVRGEPGWRSSDIVETDFAFTHVGLHWRGPALNRLELRTSGDGARWSSWQAVIVEGGPEDNPRGEWFAALVGADRHHLVQYRLPADGPVPERITVTYLNSVDGPRRPIGQILANDPRAKGTDLRADIISREEWGADESLRYEATGEESWLRTYVPPRIVAVHHTATRNFTHDAAADVRSIYAFHAVTRGWGDIGYNALIDPDGRIYEGRRGREVDPFGRLHRDILSFGVVGAHATGYNYGGASVSLLGDFMQVAPTDAAWRALEEFLVFQHRRFEIDPRATIDFARSDELWRYGLPTLCGHRDCGVTECPGDFVYRRLPALRQRVAERINGEAPTRRVIVQAPGPYNMWPGVAAYRWGGTPPYDRTFEGVWRHPGGDPDEYRIGYDDQAMAVRVVTRQTEARYELTDPGQYTLHLRPADQAFADRVTVTVQRQVVRDNADPEGVLRSTGWVPHRSIVQFYGSDYEVAGSGSGAEFRWRLPIPESGRYQVQACWASATDHTRAARYSITRDGELVGTVTMDQSERGGAWVTLGEYDVLAGQVCEVTLTAPPENDSRVVVADAVRALLVT
jgi:hypothetical protein